MRILTLVGAIFVFALFFFTLGAVSEQHNFENLTVDKNQVLVLEGDQIWLQGDIIIDGQLTIKDSNLNVNQTLDLTTSEIRINPGGELNFINTTVSTSEYSFGNESNETILSPYTLVSDAGNLSIYDSTIYYGMIWLVGGNAEITAVAPTHKGKVIRIEPYRATLIGANNDL